MATQPNIKDLWYDWLGINTYLFKQINSLSEIPVYKHLMAVITNLGDSNLLPYFLGIIAVYAVISSIAHAGSGRMRLLVWFNIVIVMAGSMLANDYSKNFLKSYFSYPRPYAALPVNEVILLESKRPEEAMRSFPSGHAMTITLLIATLWPIMSEGFRWGGVFLIFSVCWSRIAVGVHFPMDVLSGFVISLFTVCLTRTLLFSIYGILNGILQLLHRAR